MAVIGWYLHRLADPIGSLTGIGRYAVQLTRSLVERGRHDYVLLAPFEGAEAAADWPDVPVIRLGGDRRVLQAGWVLAHRPRIDRMVPGIELVHALSPVVPIAARLPTVYTIHDLFPLTHPSWKSRHARWLFRAAIRDAGHRARRVIAPSRTVAADIVDRLGIGRSRLVCIPEGLDSAFAEAEPSPPDRLAGRHGLRPGNYLLALGGLIERKNLFVLLDALASLPPADRPQLVLAGPPGSVVGDLRRRVHALGLDAVVAFTGFVDAADLPALVAGAKGLVHPALDEGFGLPVVEAMAAGVPVVAARAGALPEVVGDAGLLVAPRDIPGWTDAIRRLDDEELRDRLTRAGRRRARRFTWEATADATEEVYDTCLERPHPT